MNKNNKESEPFSIQKLTQSLKHFGTTKEEIEIIILKIKPNVYDGISSNKIFKKFILFKSNGIDNNKVKCIINEIKNYVNLTLLNLIRCLV